MTLATQDAAVVLDRRYANHDAEDFLRALVTEEFPGRIALISSFGTESALLLAITADVDRGLPVVFIDTGKMFPETLEYRDMVVDQLGLTNVRSIGPTSQTLAARDPEGQLWQFDTDACCRMRKVEPLAAAVGEVDAIVSGRKRYHGALRSFIPRVEAVDGQFKIDPLAYWSRERVEAEFKSRGLPEHPLKAEGYASIGCEPCTMPVLEGAAPRAGRWSGVGKTECGIHLSAMSAAL